MYSPNQINQYRQERDRNCNVFLWLRTHLNMLRVLHAFEYVRKPLCTVIFFGSVIPRNAQDHESNDPLSDCSDQWSGESFSRVDSMDHWSGNGFAWKECDRSVILIQILPKEHALCIFDMCLPHSTIEYLQENVYFKSWFCNYFVMCIIIYHKRTKSCIILPFTSFSVYMTIVILG